MEKSKQINYDIEALRGFAALVVVWHHIIVYPRLLDPHYVPSGIFGYGPSGHFCVLIFFILSGYVIGLSNKKPLTWRTSGAYLKKRLIRLYPIFLLTLLFAVVVTKRSFTLSEIISNAFFLQGLAGPDINPLGWSLQYEVLYYFLFILFSIFRINPFLLALLAFVVAFGNYLMYPSFSIPIVSSYAYGLVFWLLGLGLSQILVPPQQQQAPYRVLLGCIFLMLCTTQFNLFDTLFRRISTFTGITGLFAGITEWDKIAITIFDLTSLPAAFSIIYVFIHRRMQYKIFLIKALLVISSFNLIYVAKHIKQGNLDVQQYALPTLFLLAALACVFIRSTWLEYAGTHVVRIGIWLGSLSYAIYLIHFPMLILFSRIQVFSGSQTTFVTRVICLLGLILSFAYLLEKIIQPRLKSYFTAHPALENHFRSA